MDRQLLERVQELEARERDLLLAAEMGRELLERNTELELEFKSLAEENRELSQKLALHKNVGFFLSSFFLPCSPSLPRSMIN
jgi:hypothetical protein